MLISGSCDLKSVIFYSHFIKVLSPWLAFFFNAAKLTLWKNDILAFLAVSTCWHIHWDNLPIKQVSGTCKSQPVNNGSEDKQMETMAAYKAGVPNFETSWFTQPHFPKAMWCCGKLSFNDCLKLHWKRRWFSGESHCVTQRIVSKQKTPEHSFCADINARGGLFNSAVIEPAEYWWVWWPYSACCLMATQQH